MYSETHCSGGLLSNAVTTFILISNLICNWNLVIKVGKETKLKNGTKAKHKCLYKKKERADRPTDIKATIDK